MRRIVPILAVLCTGLALGVLTIAIVWSGRGSVPTLEDVPPMDPAVAAPEIARLRESRGSILAGTSLALAEDATEFSAALASQTGIQPPAAPAVSLVELLRRTAREYEVHAQRLEVQQSYTQADALRRLAEDARRVARSLDGGEPEQAELSNGTLQR